MKQKLFNIGDTDLDINNKNNFEQTIIEWINKIGIIRERLLIKKLIERYHLSESTIKRYLTNLLKNNEIIIIKKDQFEKYGLKEKDKRAAYISSPFYECNQHLLEKVIKHLLSKDQNEINIALKELQNNPSTRLNYNALGMLINVLKENNLNSDNITLILDIILKYARVGIVADASNLNSLRDMLKKKLFLFVTKDKIIENKKLIEPLINTLGVFKDGRIINFLEVLIKLGVKDEFRWVFTTWDISTTLNKYNAELFDLQIKYKNEPEMLKFILRVRDCININLNTYKDNLKPINKALKEVKYYPPSSS